MNLWLMFNWIDGVILVVVIYLVLDGWEEGGVKLASGLVSFLAALWLAVKFGTNTGGFLVAKFGIGKLWSNVLGYLIIATAGELAVGEIIRHLVFRLPRGVKESKINRFAGGTLSVLKAMATVTIGLLVITALPVKGSIKSDIGDSKLGSALMFSVQKYAGGVKLSVDEAAKQAVRFLTVKPESGERISLEGLVGDCGLKVDEGAEWRILELINGERAKTGAKKLTIDSRMVTAARLYGRDMMERKYFSHYSPEGEDAEDRLQAAGVKYRLMGENLAFAPDVQTAHQGLMESEGHKKNILDPEFRRVGIGVIDNGIYGKMFVQVFTD